MPPTKTVWSSSGLIANVRSYQAWSRVKSVLEALPWSHQSVELLTSLQLLPLLVLTLIPPTPSAEPCSKAYSLLLLVGEQAISIRCQYSPAIAGGAGVMFVQVP